MSLLVSVIVVFLKYFLFGSIFNKYIYFYFLKFIFDINASKQFKNI